jgi:hypothetical protein
MNDLERELRDVLEERSRDARAGQASAPKVLRRARRRQAATALATVATVTAVVAGSVAALSAIRKQEPVVTDSGLHKMRTASINDATISSPADWYLLALPTPIDEIIQLTNFDPASTTPCFTTGAADLPSDGVLLVVERGTGSIGDDAPRWPVPLEYDSAPSACRPGGLMESPEPGLPWREEASWVSEDGTLPYTAHLVYGPEASDADRSALISSFESLSVRDPSDPLLIDSPSYVLGSGDGWNLVASMSPGGGPDLSLLTARNRAGAGAFTVPESGHLESTSKTISGITYVWGAASFEVASLMMTTDTGAGTAEILELPPSFDAPFNAFLAYAPVGTEWTLTALNGDGEQVAEAGGGGAVEAPPCAPFEDNPAPQSLPLPTAENAQSWLRDALVAARTVLADCGRYEFVSPGSLAAIEPTLNYNTSDTASAGTISIREAAAGHLLLVTADDRGNAWCIADDAAGDTTTYGNVDAATLEQCVGGWDLPARRKPVQASIEHGGSYWAVYVAVEPDEGRVLADARDRVEAAGYTPGGGDLACDQGAAEALGMERQAQAMTVAVYFDTRDDAETFFGLLASRLEPPPVGIANVTTLCLD